MTVADSSIADPSARLSSPEVSLGGTLRRAVARDLRVRVRSPGEWLNPLVFFVIVVTLFPLGIGPGPGTLALIAPGVLWISALLALLLSFDGLFASDHRDGTLEQLVLGDAPLSLVVLGKVFAHWLLNGLPLVMLSPLLAILMQLPVEALPVLAASLAIGTLALGLIGAIGAALTVGVNHGGVLLSLLVLPLTTPVLIFGASATAAAAEGYEAGGQLSLLAAVLAASLALAPLAAAAALRVTAASEG